jgi:hypothetical protein
LYHRKSVGWAVAAAAPEREKEARTVRSIRRKAGARHRAFVPIFALAAALLALLPATALAADPITWSVTESRYGPVPGVDPVIAFANVPAPFPGIGMTVGPNTAYGMGIWQAIQSVYVFGFANGPITPPVPPNPPTPPTPAQTNLAGKDIDVGTRLELKFTKTAGQKIAFVAIVCDPTARLVVEPEAGKSLTEAAYFDVKATIVRPVKSATADLSGGAFGFIADLSPDPARDYMGATFATNMHWNDIAPPTMTGTGMAGLNAAGFNGVSATFDGIFPPELLTKMGIADPANVQGFIDVTRILPGSTVATFAPMGAGDGSLWAGGWYKYRVTNSQWSTHNVMYGRAVKPAKPVAKSPKGVIKTAKPTFKWSKVSGASKYEIAVYKGAKKLFGKAGLTGTSLKCSKALPKGVWLTWKVRAKNAAGASGWASAKFKVK